MDETNVVAPKFGLKILQLSKIDYVQITYLRLWGASTIVGVPYFVTWAGHEKWRYICWDQMLFVIELLPPQSWTLFKCCISRATIWLPMHFETVMFEQIWWPIYLVTPLWLTSWLSRITSNMPIIMISTHNHLQGCHEPWGWVDSNDKSLQDVFTNEMRSKFDIDLKSIGTHVDLSLNINSPHKGQTHLMGTMTHDYHGMLRLLKWNNLGKFFYIVLRRVHSWCQISAFKVGTIKTFFFSRLV